MRMQFPKAIFYSVFLAFFATHAAAEQDIDGGKDHPLLTRYPGFSIIQYNAVEFDKADVIAGAAFVDDGGNNALPVKSVEGAVTNIKYRYEGEDVSTYALFSNYTNALQKLDADITFACEGPKNCGLQGVFINLLLNDNPNIYRGLLVEVPDDFAIISGVATSGDTRANIMVVMGTHHGTGRRYVNQSIITSAALDADKLQIGSLEDLTNGLAETGSIVLDGILFDFDTADLKTGSDVVLDVLEAYLEINPDVEVFIVGHTDNTGSYEYNLGLSNDRAATVVENLIERGIARKRMSAIGIGPVSPVALNDTPEGQALNRRVEMVIK